MKIRTVLRDINPTELGITASHEHLLWSVPAPYAQEDLDLGLYSVTDAIAELNYFKTAGGNALVEMTTVEIGRDPVALKYISEKTGIHIIAATGHNKNKFSEAYTRDLSIDDIFNNLMTDITVGMSDTQIKAGVIKASTSKNKATQSEQRVIKAVGKAHQATGAPVSTHTEAGTFALEQIDLLKQAGVSVEKLLIGHLDRNLPIDQYFSIASTGVYLGFDQIGKNKYWPDSERVKIIKELVDSGFAHKIIISGDIARKSSWHTNNSKVDGIANMILNFVPQLLEMGVSKSDIHTIIIKNPANFLEF